jgi:Fic family protein
MEMLIERTKETYYEALQNSSIEWHNNKSDYTSFVRYYLGVVLKGYNEFQDRIEHLKYRRLSKADRVKAVFEKKLGLVKKSDIATLCPDISETTIERALKELLEVGFIEKLGKGRATGYVKR